MSLKKGTMNGIMVTAIGVSIVMGGQFAGWNYGLTNGWVNMLIAFAISLVFYVGLMQCISEMGTTWPSAGGLSTFVKLAYGNWAGTLTGIAIGITLISCTGMIALFIVGYASSLFPISEELLKIILFILMLIIGLREVKNLLMLTLISGGIAVITILTYSIGILPDFKASNLNLTEADISVAGILGALPFSIWLFAAVEYTVSTSEETKNPQRDIPFGMNAPVVILAITGLCILTTSTGAVGIPTLSNATDPLIASLGSNHPTLRIIITTGVLLGLFAGFLSMIFSSTRQVFDIAREGYLPKILLKLNKHGTPAYAVLLVTFCGFFISLLNAERVMLGIVVMFTTIYIIIAASYLKLFSKFKNVQRGYKAIGGIYTGWFILITSIFIFAISFKFDAVIMTPFVVLVLIVSVKFLQKKLKPSATPKSLGRSD